MTMFKQKTTLRQNIQNEDRNWFVIDAEGKNLGHVATMAADYISGKYRVDFTPHSDSGEYVVILNAEKIQVSGSKEESKEYFRHSGYLGNLKRETLKEVREKNPTRILEQAVEGMLAKNKLRKIQMRRLRLIVGSENPYAAQKPTQLMSNEA